LCRFIEDHKDRSQTMTRGRQPIAGNGEAAERAQCGGQPEVPNSVRLIGLRQAGKN
jgi:hypothetical protein